MSRRLSLAFPWLLAAFVVLSIVHDQVRSRSATSIGPAVTARTAEGPTAIDPVCSMEVRRAASHRVDRGGTAYFFCSEPCRDDFAADPDRFAAAPAAPARHTMRGLPTWMYQGGIAVVLVLSFGLFEIVSRSGRSGAAPLAARLDVTGRLVRRALKWPPLVALLRIVVVAAFLLVIGAGLFGNQNPAMNVAPLATWTIWWAGLVFLILYLGKAWCTVCPWDAIATWIERLSLWGPRKGGLGLGLPWPRALRNIWFAVVLFLLLTWVELGMGITLVPRATAYVGLGMIGLAVASALLFDRKAFCRYGCLVGRVSGLYSLFSGIELRATDASVCASCRTMDCYRGNDRGDGCPTFQFPRTMTSSTYCTLCTECVKTCPHDNVSLRLRPWGADLAQEGRPRTDEAFLALALLSMTSFHGLTMTPSWGALAASAEAATGLGSAAVFGLLMAAMLALPILVYGALVWIASRLAPGTGAGRLFVRYAYALLPIALFYHLAHNAEHFLMEGPKIVPLLSDPLGRGWDLFGTAAWRMAPLVTLEGLWGIQVAFVLVGHVYGLWISERTTSRLVPDRRRAFASQLPMLAAMVLASVVSLWLLSQPMEMRASAM